MFIDYYAILGVRPDARLEEIKAAYRRSATECHPDRGGSAKEMKLVNEAWEILSNAIFRARFDELRIGEQKRRTTSDTSTNAQAKRGAEGASGAANVSNDAAAANKSPADKVESFRRSGAILVGLAIGFSQLLSVAWVSAHPILAVGVIIGSAWVGAQVGEAVHGLMAKDGV